VSLDPDALEAAARDRTGLDHLGDGSHREGLERLVTSMNAEADLTATGEAMLSYRLTTLLAARLGIEETYRAHPEIAAEEVEGPVVVIGLPRTGTTALSQLVAADPQVRSLRTWESGAPVPPPEAATEHTDPRIAECEAGLAMMYETFPRMRRLHHAEATTATECQDLLGMSFRTFHFDGFAHVPSYTAWAVDADMRAAYDYHRRTLRLLQWHCPPRLWHLKTPVHMFALDQLVATYPGAVFLWSHRDPADVLGSVCDLVHYTRSWASDRDDAQELGPQQLAAWADAVTRAMEFRARVGDQRFADLSHADLQVDPVGALRSAYDRLGLAFSDATAAAVTGWADEHPPGRHGGHDVRLEDFGLTDARVRTAFGPYLDRFDIAAPEATR
jgi:hypothetical protein